MFFKNSIKQYLRHILDGKSQITNFGVQKLTINMTVTNKAHNNERAFLFIFRRRDFGLAIIFTTIGNTSYFDNETTLWIVSTGCLTGKCLQTTQNIYIYF